MRPDPDDLSPLDGARRGDPFAWAELYSDCQPRLFAYLRMMGDSALADNERRVWSAIAERVGADDTATDPRVLVLSVAREIRGASSGLRAVGGDLDRLPDLEREVIALRVGAGLSEQDAALVLERPPTVVKAAGHRALAALGRGSAE